MLREAVAAGTEMVRNFIVLHTQCVYDILQIFCLSKGKQAKALMNAGKLVGDDVVVGIVGDALKNPACSKGFILDGFPRTGSANF